MPGSQTTPGPTGARNNAPADFAFRQVNTSAPRVDNDFGGSIACPREGGGLAYTLLYRRFADVLADALRTDRGATGCRVEVPVTRHLPHRSHRAAFPQWALVEGQTRSRVGA